MKDKLIVAVIIICAVLGFFGTMIGAMYLADGMNSALQKTFIQDRK